MQLCRAISSSWAVLCGWPAALTALAAERIATRPNRHGDGNGGRTIRFFKTRLNSETSPDVEDLIADWRRTVDLDGPDRPRLLACTRSITEASAQLGISPSDLTDHRRRGVLRPVFVIDGLRPEPRFDAAEIAKLEGLTGSRVPIDRARLLLGIPCNGVEQLVAMRLVDQETDPFIMARYDLMQIVAASINVLANDVASRATGDTKHCTLPLRTAMKAIGGRLKPWAPAFKELLDGLLPYAMTTREGPLSRRILIARGSIKTVRSLLFDPRDPAHRPITYSHFMSKVDAGETLNLGCSRSTELLSTIRTKAGTHNYLVPVDLVERLAKGHMSSTELAVRRGVSSQRAYHDATRAGVRDLGPGGFCRIAAEEEFFHSGGNTRADPLQEDRS